MIIKLVNSSHTIISCSLVNFEHKFAILIWIGMFLLGSIFQLLPMIKLPEQDFLFRCSSVCMHANWNYVDKSVIYRIITIHFPFWYVKICSSNMFCSGQCVILRLVSLFCCWSHCKQTLTEADKLAAFADFMMITVRSVNKLTCSLRQGLCNSIVRLFYRDLVESHFIGLRRSRNLQSPSVSMFILIAALDLDLIWVYDYEWPRRWWAQMAVIQSCLCVTVISVCVLAVSQPETDTVIVIPSKFLNRGWKYPLKNQGEGEGTPLK